jgi:hypothetical protein
MAKQDADSSSNSDFTPSPEASTSTPDLLDSKNQVIVTTKDQSSEAPEKLSLWRRFVGLFWDSYVADPRERKYIQKVDLHLLSVQLFELKEFDLLI